MDWLKSKQSKEEAAQDNSFSNDESEGESGEDNEGETAVSKTKKKKIEEEMLQQIMEMKAGKSVLKIIKPKTAPSKSVHFDPSVKDDDESVSGNEKSDNDDADFESENESDMQSDEDDTTGALDDNDGDSDDDMIDEDDQLEGNETAKNSLKEDIYGRVRDDLGNIVKDSKVKGTYIPPGKRLEMSEKASEKEKIILEKLRRQIKGQINRYVENMVCFESFKGTV